jgi:HEAT repeat protein
MSVQTLSLSCPTCGNASNLASRQVRFGYEFTCPFCSATSVMIIDKQLYALKAGEVVCPQCGNVNPADARFCNCGALLVDKCTYCFREISVTQKRCNHCGRLQLKNATDEQLETVAQAAIQQLSSPSEATRLHACEDLRLCGPLAEPATPLLNKILLHDSSQHVRIAACQVLSAINPGSGVVGTLLEALKKDYDNDVRRAVCETLDGIGTQAAEAAPLLCEIIGDENDDAEIRARACYTLLAIGAPGDAPIPILSETISKGRASAVQRAAWEVLSRLDPKEAIDAIEDLIRNNEQEWSVRESACLMLHRIDPNAAVGVLRTIIREPREPREKRAKRHKERESAMPDASSETLRELGELSALMRETSYQSTCELLTKLDLNAAVDTFVMVIKNDKGDLRNKIIVCKAIGDIGAGAAEAVPTLIDMLKERETRPMAAVALRGIGKPALEALESLTGFFASGDVKRVATNLIEDILHE